MKSVLAIVFGVLVQSQQTGQTAKPLGQTTKPVAVQSPPASSSAKANVTLQDRSFFVKNPILDAALLSAVVAPKTTTDGTPAATSNSDLTNTLLIAGMMNSGNNNGNNQGRSRPRSRNSRKPQFVPPPQYVPQPQFVQASVSTQFAPPAPAPKYIQQPQQPQYFAPPQQQFAPQQFAPQRSSRGYHDDNYYGYDSHSQDQRDDPLKKMVLLSGVASGKMNPLAAVAMDNNKRMSTTDAVVISSLGNSPAATVLAMGGASSGGSGLSGNALTTLAVASALSPQKDSSSSSSSSNTLGTLAALSVMSRNNGGSGGGMFGGMFDD